MALRMNFIRKLCMVLLAQCMMGTMTSAGRCFEMSPDHDIYLLVNEVLRLNCSLKLPNNNTACDIDDFILNKTRIEKGSQILSADLFKYHVAENTVEMTIPNVSLEDSGIYICRYGDSSVNQSFRPVHIGESPGEPENLVCISRNHEDLSCSFSLSKRSNIPMRWTMAFKIPWGPKVEVNCSKDLDLDIIRCGKIQISYMTYDITVKGVNVSYDVKKEKNFTIKANESIVKPDPVVNLNVTINSTKDVVTVSWEGPDGLTYEDKVTYAMDYKIKITSDWDNFTRIITNAEERSKEYSLTDLVPYTNYSVTILVKPTAAISDIYWSEPNSIHFVTAKTVPEQSVSMTTGSYLLQSCGEGDMCPVIYWKNPPRKFWNGPMVGYKINVEEIIVEESLSTMHGHIQKRNIYIDHPEYRLKRLIEPMIRNVTGLSVSSVLMPLSKTEGYKVDVTLINSEGMSRDVSQLLIPDWNKGQRLKPDWVSVEVGDTVADVSWGMSPLICHNITSATVYWCLIDDEKSFNGSNPMLHCKDIFDWSTIRLTDGCENKTSVTLQKSYDYADLRFAVSLETNNISGGLVWEKFRFKTKAVPDMPLYKVDPEGNQLVVEILYGQYYVSEGGQPERYLVYYSECTSETKCSSDVKTETFDANFTMPVHKIQNLKPGARYRVYVTASNKFGKSREGLPVEKKMENEDSSDSSKVLGAVLGGVCGVLVIGVVIVVLFCIRKRHREMKADLEVTVMEPLDTGSGREFFTMLKDSDTAKYKLEDNHDSGKGSDSPGSSLGQADSVQLQDGMANCENFNNNGSDSPVLGKNSDRQHLVHADQRSSPVLSGYHKHVSDATINDQGIIEFSEDEIDDDIQNTDSLKKMLKVNENGKAPNLEKMPVERIGIDKDTLTFSSEVKKDDFKKKTNEVLGEDYSVATTLHGQNKEVSIPSDVSARESEVVGEFSKIKQDVKENKEDELHTTNDLEAFDLINERSDTEFVSDSSDSNAVDFEDIPIDESSNHYKNPDQVSLGGGSTVTDSSDSGSIDSEDIEDDKKINAGAKELDGAFVIESCHIIEETDKNSVEKVDINKESDNGESESGHILGGAILESKESKAIENSNKSAKEGSMSEDGKSTSGPASLEPYIVAGLGSNGFVKSSKLNKDNNSIENSKEDSFAKQFKGHNDISVQSPSDTHTELC